MTQYRFLKSMALAVTGYFVAAAVVSNVQLAFFTYNRLEQGKPKAEIEQEYTLIVREQL